MLMNDENYDGDNEYGANVFMNFVNFADHDIEDPTDPVNYDIYGDRRTNGMNSTSPFTNTNFHIH